MRFVSGRTLEIEHGRQGAQAGGWERLMGGKSSKLEHGRHGAPAGGWESVKFVTMMGLTALTVISTSESDASSTNVVVLTLLEVERCTDLCVL